MQAGEYRRAARFGMLGLLLLAAAAHGAELRLAWDPPTDVNGAVLTDLAGFRVCHGTQSRAYTTTLDVGMNLAAALPNLQPNTTYYIAVKAHAVSGEESDASEELAWVSPANYTIAVSASPSAGGSVGGGGSFASGSMLTVTATANGGYTFSEWTENGNQVSTSSSYTFTPSANRTLVANFAVSSPVKFRFPLAGYTPYTVPVASAFDHSGGRYIANGEIVAYTGEKGTVKDNIEPPLMGTLSSYKKTDGTAFTCNRNYRGTTLTGATTLNYDGHPGWDYVVSVGTPVYAVADGVVTQVATDTSFGKYISLQHGTGYQSQYLHLNEQLVALNATVTKGQMIGRSGNSGGVSAHLHYEVRKYVSGNWVSVDPYGWTGIGADPYQTANTKLWEDSAAFDGAFDAGNHCKWISWFGWYNDQNWPWIWDYQFNDWLWVMDNGPENVWFFSNSRQTWFWARTDWYRWVWYIGDPSLTWRSN